MMEDIQCAECATSFRPGRRTQRFCSKPCKIRFLHRDWVRRNPERAKEIDANRPNKAERVAYVRQWRQDNHELVLATDRVRHLDRREEANERRAQWYRENTEHSQAMTKKAYRQTRATKPWTILVQRAKGRAEKFGLPFDLTMEWAESRWTGKCEVSGIEFDTTNGTRRGRLFSPSLDQIRPREGYTQENSRFVLWAVNAMKGTGTDSEVLVIAKAISENENFIPKA